MRMFMYKGGYNGNCTRCRLAGIVDILSVGKNANILLLKFVKTKTNKQAKNYSKSKPIKHSSRNN